MEEKIFLKELECYINVSDVANKNPLMSPGRCFDLSKLPNESIKKEMDSFIRYRGKTLTPLSIRSDLYPYNQLCWFLSEKMPEMNTFKNMNMELMERKCKAWLLQHGKHITQSRIKTATGRTEISDSELIKFIRKVYAYFNNEETGSFNYDSDVWYLEGIPFELKDNPTKRVKSLNFIKIPQALIRQEIKRIIYIHLSQKALGTVQAEMSAINRFTKYLSEKYSNIVSLHEINRDLIEDYLIYTNTEATGRKSYAKELEHLKTVFNAAALILDDDKLESMFYQDDIGKQPETIYKVYSDSELIRLNKAIADMDVQIARALVLHQMLGTRISETLTLKQDAIYKGESGKWIIRIKQIKSRRTYEKVINDDVRALFDKSCEYTNDKFGKQEYVFVNEKIPAIPMQYSRIQYLLMAMITKENLVDDNGERFGVGTHIFRHCFGKRLTEMNVDDVTIAKLLGHANTSSVRFYRKIGNKVLSAETKGMRATMDKTIQDLIGEWGDEE